MPFRLTNAICHRVILAIKKTIESEFTIISRKRIEAKVSFSSCFALCSASVDDVIAYRNFFSRKQIHVYDKMPCSVQLGMIRNAMSSENMHIQAEIVSSKIMLEEIIEIQKNSFFPLICFMKLLVKSLSFY